MPFIPKTTTTAPREERGDTDYAPIPAGWYAAAIDNALVRVHNNKRMLAFVFRITDGDYRNRLVFENFYLTDAAKERAMKDVHNIVDDCGLAFDGTDEQLCLEIGAIKGREIDLKVGVDAERDGFKAKNRYRDSAPAWTKVKRGVGTAGVPAAGAMPPPPPVHGAPEVVFPANNEDMPF